jgi:hypothetical protein
MEMSQVSVLARSEPGEGDTSPSAARRAVASVLFHHHHPMTMSKLTLKRCRQMARALTALLLGLLITQTASAQAQDPGRSYADRQNPRLSKSGPIYMDPNVYAYTAEFAKRFQMPDEWISPDLKGADAVAWRMMPSYQECGWGGDPKACRQVMECNIDLYFDHQRNPLPWDSKRPDRYTYILGSSIRFLSNAPRREALNHPNYPVARRKLFEPARAGDHWSADDSPFIDPQTGKGLSIQDFSGYIPFTGYDKEVFPGMALLTLLDPGCRGGSNNAAYALANDLVRRPVNPKDKDIVHAILVPPSWRDRITQAAKDHQERQDAFFKREGEKAIKALKEKKAQQ